MFVTYVKPSTKTVADTRMNNTELINAAITGRMPEVLHSASFFDTLTIYANNPRPIVQQQHFIEALREGINIPKEYYTFRIPKATGGFRTIEAPEYNLKASQRKIADILTHSLRVLPHSASYAYTRGRCAYDSLIKHKNSNARWFLKIDLKDFFPSITKQVIIDCLKNIYPIGMYAPEHIEMLAEIAVNEQGVLPQGSPLSPMLSNLVMVEFDYRLTKLLKGYTYTRYADDILITSPYTFQFSTIVSQINGLFTELGLPMQINMGKLRYSSMAGRNWNLGLMYTDEQSITIGSKKKRLIHSMTSNFMVDLEHNRQWTHYRLYQLLGNLSYLRNIEPDYYNKLVNRYSVKHNQDVMDALLAEIKSPQI